MQTTLFFGEVEAGHSPLKSRHSHCLSRSTSTPKSYSLIGAAQGHSNSSNGDAKTAPGLSRSAFGDAIVYRCLSLPKGAELSAYTLCHGLKTSFDRRGVAAYMRMLEREGLIESIGKVVVPRENGNPSTGTLYMRK